jgi:hypothetical protein
MDDVWPALLPSVWPAVIVFVLAGAVKGVIGLGLPTVAMALLAQWMTPADAAGLLIVPSFVTNVWQIGSWGTLKPKLRRFGALQIGVCGGTWLGMFALGAPSGAWASAASGVALIVYAAWGLTGARLSVRRGDERWLGPLVGCATGAISAVTGMFVVPAVPYLQSLGLERDELVQVMGLSFTTSTIALAVGLYGSGSYSSGALTTSTVMVLPALAGMSAGQAIRRVLFSPPVFRTCFLVSLVALGIHLAIRNH